jgi:hypothetical protein
MAGSLDETGAITHDRQQHTAVFSAQQLRAQHADAAMQLAVLLNDAYACSCMVDSATFLQV